MNPNNTYTHIPKPRKPIRADSKGIGFNAHSRKEFLKQVNSMMQMTRFMPNYEKKLYAGKGQEELLESMSQYGDPYEDENGYLTASFGKVQRAKGKDGESIRAAGQAQGVTGLYFDDQENLNDRIYVAGLEPEDYDDYTANPLINEELWAYANELLEDEERSYYEIIMEQGLGEMNPTEAFGLLVSMLESRTRVWGGMDQVFGSPDLSGTERIQVFKEWMDQNQGELQMGQLGFLQMFLDIEQSFNSHVLPLFGGSADYIHSEEDRNNVQAFMNQMSTKIAQFVGVADLSNISDEELQQMSNRQLQAVEIWDAWLNPDRKDIINQNQDIKEQEWSA